MPVGTEPERWKPWHAHPGEAWNPLYAHLYPDQMSGSLLSAVYRLVDGSVEAGITFH